MIDPKFANENVSMPIPPVAVDAKKTSASFHLGEENCLSIFTQPMSAPESHRYWVACNRNTYTAYLASPLRCPKVTPTPVFLIGFGTADEARLAEDLLAEADPKELTELLAAWHERDDVTFIFPPDPEPPGAYVMFAETER